jgi:gamma-glutamyl:cysteine ligase YbdK (ATP-grasp superfamily)
MVLPLLPGIAASSPFVEGHAAENMDARLAAYRNNAKRVPSVSGSVVPERVFTQGAYEAELLEGIYRDLAPLDPEGVLRNEWVNARGCIARFDRMAIEIRLLDVQECPAADLAVVGAVTSVVQALTEEAWSRVTDLKEWDEARLVSILDVAVRNGSDAIVDDGRFLGVFGYPERGPARLGDVWQHLVESVTTHDAAYAEWSEPLQVILQEGCLAARLRRAVGEKVSHENLYDVYRTLERCLAEGTMFRV